jgi:hypothetical protein
MALDGVIYEGRTMSLQPPSEFVSLDPALGGGALGGIPDTPNKLFIGGLPTYLGDDQVQELLKSFGELKSFNLVKEGAVNGGGSKVSRLPCFVRNPAQLTLRVSLSASTSTPRSQTWLFKVFTTSSLVIVHWWFSVRLWAETLVSQMPCLVLSASCHRVSPFSATLIMRFSRLLALLTPST